MKNKVVKTHCKQGFTLIELLVVVLIIGLLAAVALPQYNKAILKSRLVEYEVVLKSILEAEHAYYLENDSYRQNFPLSKLDIEIPPCKLPPGITFSNSAISQCSYAFYENPRGNRFNLKWPNATVVLQDSNGVPRGFLLMMGYADYNGNPRSSFMCDSGSSTEGCAKLGFTRNITGDLFGQP